MKKILGAITKLCNEQNLIQDGDKIAVGVSGGKDSLLLLTLLKKLQSFYDKKFDLIAISIDLSNGAMDFSKIEAYCEKLNVPYYKQTTNIFEIVFDIRKEKNPCSLCANMRRGALNLYAKKLGCNKVALAHHADDLIETLLISLFFEGRLSTFQPSTYLSKVDITVIRPMLYVSENDVVKNSKDLPIVKNICPVDKHTERQGTKQLLDILENKYPNAKKQILTAITHPERTNLWKNNKN